MRKFLSRLGRGNVCECCGAAIHESAFRTAAKLEEFELILCDDCFSQRIVMSLTKHPHLKPER